MPTPTASEILQTLILLDQLSASVIRHITAYKDVQGADDETIQRQLAALAERNNARFAEVRDQLKAIAAAGK